MSDQFLTSLQGQILFVLLYLWTIFWKGLALWRAAKQGQKYWFVALLIVNSIGILEIVYLFRFATKKLTWQELKSYFSNLSLNNFRKK
ncbi:MAG TPA: DUF5652 family protein [Patescibacteria group bacterium]|nr:DUF5652 family protein [Patescibacteria group bacterium]